jgi:hypothetical protein
MSSLAAHTQVGKGYKRLVGVNVEYLTQCTTIKPAEFGGSPALLDYYAALTPPIHPCEVNLNGDLLSTDYVLEVDFHPLAWFELLNLFQFGMIIYIIFYTLVGLMSLMLIGVIYVINRLLTKLRNPPAFQSVNLFFLLAEAPTQGVMVGFVPCFLCVLWVWIWLQSWINGGPMGSADPVNSPSNLNFEGTSGNWLDTAVLDVERIELYRIGRMGTSFMILGLYGTFLVARLVIPNWDTESSKEPDNPISKAKKDILYDDDDEEELPPTTTFVPKTWKRANFMYITFACNLLLMLLWEFSYSSYYEEYQFELLIAFKFIFMQVRLR